VQSLWCKRDVNPSFFSTGFKLLNADTQKFQEAIDCISRSQDPD
jgi:hypothetical protein